PERHAGAQSLHPRAARLGGLPPDRGRVRPRRTARGRDEVLLRPARRPRARRLGVLLVRPAPLRQPDGHPHLPGVARRALVPHRRPARRRRHPRRLDLVDHHGALSRRPPAPGARRSRGVPGSHPRGGEAPAAVRRPGGPGAGHVAPTGGGRLATGRGRVTTAAFIAASARVEQVALAAAVVGLLALLLFPRRERTAVGADAMTPRTSALLLAGLLVFAGAVRLVGLQRELTVPWVFPEMTTVLVDHRARVAGGWTDWLASWHNFQVGSTDQSALVLPVFAGFYRLLGPRFHLSALVGAVFGISAVWLAWALGRRAVSPLFGLCFAALVATSPLQVLWSRLGGIHGVSVAHVLLVLWLSYTAGRR